jgi:leader peptidase (prepilin peptidase)/N-methyltransferase
MPFQSLPPNLAWGLLAFWIVATGGVVGSFLNVVVYRVPAGMNVAWPGSHCPLCGHSIRWFDNVPVLGWILLRGRCRDCKAPISIRYPLVEGGAAAMFGVLALREIFRNGVNLPLGALEASGPGALRPLATLAGVCGFHLLLLCTLLVAALIALDGKRVPWRLFLPVLLVGILAPPVWPWLHPVGAWIGVEDCPFPGVVDAALGLATGLLLAGVESLSGRGRRPGSDLRAGAICVALVLGWQAGLMLTIAAVAVFELLRLAAWRLPEVGRVPALAWLGLGTLGWILDWAQLVQWARLW